MQQRLEVSRRLLLSGATVGAATGGAVATAANSLSGPAFWAGLFAGLLLGPPCFVIGAALTRWAARRYVHR